MMTTSYLIRDTALADADRRELIARVGAVSLHSRIHMRFRAVINGVKRTGLRNVTSVRLTLCRKPDTLHGI